MFHKLADGTILEYEGNENGKININGALKLENKVLRIPKYIDGLAVEKILPGAFRGKDIEKVILPDSVATIHTYAFEGCRNLKEINLPHSLNIICYAAFSNCVSLNSMVIPRNAQFQGEIFSGCTNLQEVKIECNARFVPAGTFRNCPLKKLYLPSTLEAIEHTAMMGVPKSMKIFCENNPYIEKFAREKGFRLNCNSELDAFLSKVSSDKLIDDKSLKR